MTIDLLLEALIAQADGDDPPLTSRLRLTVRLGGFIIKGEIVSERAYRVALGKLAAHDEPEARDTLEHAIHSVAVSAGFLHLRTEKGGLERIRLDRIEAFACELVS